MPDVNRQTATKHRHVLMRRSNSHRSTRFPLLIAAAILAPFAGCGTDGGGSLFSNSFFSDAPGTNGSRSKEQINALADKDPWQPGSSIRVTAGQ